MEDRSKYSAAESLVGYLYQCRLALLEALRRLRTDPDISVAIETLDDVVFEKNGTPTEIIQVKHHTSRKANLTNSSSDLWKTIRIWCDLFLAGQIKENTMLYLMTTEKSSKNTAAYYLRIEERNIAEAENILLSASNESSNKSNSEAYQKFNSLSSENRTELLDRVYILDNCPLSKEIQPQLLNLLWGFCERQHVSHLLEYLEGWWFQRIINGIENNNCFKLTGIEIDCQLNFLREQFKSDSLPIHPEIKSTIPDIKHFSNFTFAKQLRLINVSEKRIQTAAINFYRAFEQRSRWVRESLLIDDELEQYDDTLIEEWETRFDQENDIMSVNQTSDDRIASGKKIYNWVETEANFPIRPSCQERFITRGSYQILANKLRVGWHPDFKMYMKVHHTEDT